MKFEQHPIRDRDGNIIASFVRPVPDKQDVIMEIIRALFFGSIGVMGIYLLLTWGSR